MLDHISVLLILIIRPVRLDDAVDAVDGAGDAVRGDEFGEIAGMSISKIYKEGDFGGNGGKGEEIHRSRKSTEMPKSLAMLPKPTTR